MSTISIWDWFLSLLGINSGTASSTHVDGLHRTDEIDPETGRIAQFVIAPGGYRIRVPQQSELSHSMSELLPSVRASLAMIPPLPHVVAEMLREVQNASSTSETVAAVASSDAGLAAALLHTVNSAAMGLNRKITSVSEAVSYLGFSVVKSVVLRLRLDETMRVHPDYATEAEDLWVHSLATSYVAEVLAERVPGVDRGFISTLALMHDIGKLAMLSQLGDRKEKIDLLDGTDVGRNEREAMALGCDHAGLGAALANTWKLPGDLVRAIRFHHHPGQAFEATDPKALRQAAYIVFIADQLAKFAYPYADNVEISEIGPEAGELLNMDVSVAALLDEKVRKAISRAIFFAADHAKAPRSVVRPFIKFRTGEAARIMLASRGDSSATRVSIDDARAKTIFEPIQEDDTTKVRHALCRSTAAEIKKSIQTTVSQLDHLDLTVHLRGIAEQMIRHLLPNLIDTAFTGSVDVVELHQNKRLTLGIRTKKLAFAERIRPDATPEQGALLLETELSSLINLGWITGAATSSDGTALLLDLQ